MQPENLRAALDVRDSNAERLDHGFHETRVLTKLPAWAVIGGFAAIAMFLVTLSFLFTTPNQSPDAQGFLLKDFFLLGIAVWLTGEAMGARARLPQGAQRAVNSTFNSSSTLA